MWFFGTLLFIAIAVALAGFSLANADRIVPELVLWDLGVRHALTQVKLVHAMLVAFGSGAVVTLFVDAVRDVRQRAHQRLLKRRVQELEAELIALRNLPLDDALPRIVDGDQS